ncbi:MAG: hypothetical protein EOM67_14660, partial [Spirochaetia bacterium]|nr:hypothetical protein [Spirochaetia bacterium]
MDRLVLAYGQIRAASVLRGQEIRQLTEAGIPVIEELRKKFEALGETGITAADVFDKVSARLVPFSMIKEMFEDMTSASGKFYKMQEIQAETLKGKVSNLKDAYQIMFSEIGEKGDSILKGGVDTLRFLISNYEDVGKTILELTLTYGAYKAVVLSLTAVEKARYSATLMMGAAEKTITTWQGLRVAMTNALTAAQERLNIAMAKNPYLLAGVAVAALGYGIYKLISYQTDLEKSLERLEESYAKTSAETGVQVKELDRLYARLQLAKEGSAEYLKARNDIERTFGDTLSGLKNEKGGVLDLADAYEVLKTKIIETAQERGYEKAMEGAKEDLAKGIEKQLKGLYDALDRTTKLSSYEKERLKEALTPVLWGTKDFESLDTETKRLFNSLTEAKAKFGGGAYDKNPLQAYLDTSNRLQDSFDKTEQTAQKMFKTIGGETGGEMWPPKPEWLNASDWEQELTKYALTLNKFGELVTRKGDESIEDFLSRLREDYANTSDLISSRSKLAGEDVSGLKERLAVLSGAFNVLGISPIEA